jgi:signal transduction histidine kinase
MSGFAASAAAAVATAQDVAEQTRRRSIAAAEHERARWARELHDETLQELAALKLLLASVRRAEDPDERRALLEEAAERIDIGVRSLRGLITDLRPAALDALGLAAALEALVERVALSGEMTVDLDVDLAFDSGREPTRLARELEDAVYRLVQEALTNAAKHSGGAHAVVTVRESAETVDVEVRDDGTGFETTEATSGFGILGMRERAALFGGSLTIESDNAEGTTVRLSLPVTRAVDDEATALSA